MRLRSAAAAVAIGLVGAFAVQPAIAAPGPSHAAAAAWAHRTYINDRSLGRRHFRLIGLRAVVTARDGSTITAFAAVLDSADGTGQIVLLFRGRRFLGWAGAYDTLRLALGTAGRAIAVTYGVFRGRDPLCCPSRRKMIHYRWNGRRIVADGTPPLIYGRRGNRLHLAR